nr:zinc protease PQQL-like isoform X2 [Nicotiana tomentosiformis]
MEPELHEKDEVWEEQYSSEDEEEEPNEFQLLEPLEVLDLQQVFPTQPFETDYEVLDSGVTYYVKRSANTNDKGLIHLTLIVKAGAVCEEENELGVAHIIEHLVLEGYGYSDPDALDYLQAFKHQCGAHQQALTLSDYTIYNFVVTNTVNLKKAIALMAAISQELDFTSDELEKEKRIVSQELWNDSQIIEKKHQLTFSTHLFQGTKGFYTKWYVPSNMAVIVVGDITETQNIIDLIKTYFERQPRGMPQHLEFPLPKHTEPRLIAHVDSALVKWRMSVVYVTFMFEKEGWKCVNDVFINIQRMLLQKVILGRLKKRFSSMSKPKQLQYSRDDSHMYTIYVVSVECEGYETNKVLETFLVEIARMRVHGIKENELSEGKDFCLCIPKGRYLNHHDRSSEQLRRTYTSHFVYNEADFSPKLEAQVMIALTKRINMELIKNFCEMQFAASNLSVIIFQSKTFVTQEEMKRSLQKITDFEKEGSFPSWSDEEMEGLTNLIQEMEIESGKIVERLEHFDIGAVELILSNGMQVTYQCTKNDDKVVLRGFSYGGLSEVTETDILSCSYSSVIGQIIWLYSSKNLPMIRDKVNFAIEVDEYKRAFCGNFDSSDIELALQILYLLFTSDLEPEEEEFQALIEDLKIRLSPAHQQPADVLIDTVKEINSGKSCYYKAPVAEDMSNIDATKAWQYFQNCFRGPSSFRVILVGNLDTASVNSLLSRYLGGIPRPHRPIMKFQRGKLTTAPFHFPPTVIKEEVSLAVGSGNGMYTCISFPLRFNNQTLEEDLLLLIILRNLLKVKVTQVLRHEKGIAYNVDVDTFNPNGDWSCSGSKPGTINFNLLIKDNDAAQMAVDAVVHEIEQLKEVGPSQNLVQHVLDRRPSLEEEERNTSLMNQMLQAYGSNLYAGNIDQSYKILRDMNRRAWDLFNADVAKSTLKRMLPYPCQEQHTIVNLRC